MEGLGGSDAEQEALCSSALSAGLESAEDYMEVSLARLDALRRKGPSQIEALRKAFLDTNQLMEVGGVRTKLESQQCDDDFYGY